MLRELLALIAAISLNTCSVDPTSAPTGKIAPVATSEHFFLNLAPVRRLFCGNSIGTGEVIDRNRVFTAAHVTGTMTECVDDATGETGRVIYHNPDLDIAVLEFAPDVLPERLIPYSCAGFKDGNTYYAIGWQNGMELVVNRVKGTSIIDDRGDKRTGVAFNHVALVRGYIIPGMSGGPIVDENGVMVGTSQATNHDGRSWSRPISDTYLCELNENAR